MFVAELPLPAVREAIVALLREAGITPPETGTMILRTFAPMKDAPDGTVRIEISESTPS